MDSNKKLSDKQIRFCKEYVIDFNATRAALDAGYSKKTAYSIGHENLKKPEIQLYIQTLVKKVENKLEITQERILQEYARLAFFDIGNLYDETGKLKAIDDLDEDTRRAIVGLDITVESSAENGSTDYVKKVKMADKKGALQDLAKINNMFIEKVDLNANLIIINDDIPKK